MSHHSTDRGQQSTTVRNLIGTTSRTIVRMLGSGRAGSRPMSVEEEAKRQSAHVRPVAFRPELY